MALFLQGRTLPVTAAAVVPSSGSAPRRHARTPVAARPMASAPTSSLLSAGRRRLAAVVSSAWARGGAPSRAMTVRAMASSSSSSSSTKAVADADVIENNSETDGAARTGGYPYADIEAKWQKHWADNKTFKTPEQVDTSKPKFYALDMFPYPRYALS